MHFIVKLRVNTIPLFGNNKKYDLSKYNSQYLTISEDGLKNRPWKQEEINKITKILNQK
jgi:hypothetical protein